MENLTDAQLILAYRAGTTAAFDQLIQRYAQILYRFVLKLVTVPDEAHDIVQESFIKSWKYVKQYDVDKSFKTWIFTITYRTALDYLRKKKNIHFSQLSDENTDFEETIQDTSPLPDEIFEQTEQVDNMQKALALIPLPDRTILLLKHGEEMTFEEIASILKKPMNTVKSQYRRSLLNLKKHLMHQK